MIDSETSLDPKENITRIDVYIGVPHFTPNIHGLWLYTKDMVDLWNNQRKNVISFIERNKREIGRMKKRENRILVSLLILFFFQVIECNFSKRYILIFYYLDIDGYLIDNKQGNLINTEVHKKKKFNGATFW